MLKWLSFFPSLSVLWKIKLPYRCYIVTQSIFGFFTMSNSVAQSCRTLPPQGLQHTSLPCPSPSSWNLLKLMSIESVMTSNHPLLSFSSWVQSCPASGSFQMNQFFVSGGQSIGVSVSASVLPMNTQDWSPLRWTGWISFLSKGLSRVFSNTTV